MNKKYKKFLSVVVTIGVMTGGMLMSASDGNAGYLTYEPYVSQDVALNIKMDQIEGWRSVESRGSYGSYAQVQFLGQFKGKFAPSFVVTIKSADKVSFKPLTLEGMVEDLIAKKLHFREAKVLSRKDIEVVGLPAVEIILTYKTPESLKDIQPKFISVQERIILFQKGDRFYEVKYMNPEQEFSLYDDAFTHCVETLKIK